MKKISLTVAGILVVAALSWLIASDRIAPGEPDIQIESGNVPEFALQSFGGQTVSLSDFTGKPLVINSWAAWCPFCRKELVEFAKAQEEFGDQVVIIAIDRAESLDVAREHTDDLGVTDNLTFLLDPKDSFYKAIDGFSMPETLFVDASGTIAFHKRGPMEIEEIRDRINQLLN